MNKGNQKGITLIALIITIIVILILVAVSVSTISQSGLFDHAKDATNKWADEQDKEANIGDEVDKLIDEHVVDYYVGVDEDEDIVLIDKKTKNPTEFQKAYIKYEGENIEISDLIQTDYDYLYIMGWHIARKLAELGKVENPNDVCETQQEITLVKDGISYIGEVTIINNG